MQAAPKRSRSHRGFGGLRRFIARRLIPALLVVATIGVLIAWATSHWKYTTGLVRWDGLPLLGGEGRRFGAWRMILDHSAGDLFIEFIREGSASATDGRVSRWTVGDASVSGRAVPVWYQELSVQDGWSVRGYGVARKQTAGFTRDDLLVLRAPSLLLAGLLAGVTGLWIGVLAWCRRRRVRLQLCANCSYELNGLPPETACPECGADRLVVNRIGAAAWMLGWAACAWMWVARRRLGRDAKPLSPDERTAMRGLFDEQLLATVRVADVVRVDLPGSRVALRMAGKHAAAVFASPAGIALGNLVVLAREQSAPDDEARRDRRTSVLFHELVHVAQYRELGVRGFLTRYLGAWLVNGRDYGSIPLEVQAYDLQDRFDRGTLAPEDVRAAMSRWGH